MMRHAAIDGKPRHLWGWRAPGPHHMAMRASMLLGGGEKPQSKGFSVGSKADNFDRFGSILDQGDTGDCVENSITKQFRYARAVYGWDAFQPSVLGLYAAVRERIMGVPLTEDSGSTVTDGLLGATRVGVCGEPAWPSDNPGRRFMLEPSRAAWDEMAKNRVVRGYALDDLDWILACLTPQRGNSHGFLVSFGVALPESFLDMPADGVMPMPKDGEPFIGNHCMTWTGFDLEAELLDTVNSWGTSFAQGGRFRMPFAYVRQYLALDFCTVHEVTRP